jgi:hypothetical protein
MVPTSNVTVGLPFTENLSLWFPEAKSVRAGVIAYNLAVVPAELPIAKDFTAAAPPVVET